MVCSLSKNQVRLTPLLRRYSRLLSIMAFVLFLAGCIAACSTKSPLQPVPKEAKATITVSVSPDDISVPLRIVGNTAIDTVVTGTATFGGLETGTYHVEFGVASTWLPPLNPERVLVLSSGDTETLETEYLKERRLTYGAGATDPCWSPDQQHIAFVGKVNGDDDDILVLEVATGTITAMTSDNGVSDHQNPSWAPDGSHIIVSVDHIELHQIMFPSGIIRVYDASTCISPPGSFHVRYPRWTKGMTKLVFVMRGFSLYSYTGPFSCRLITYGVEAENIYNPELSPTGNTIVFSEELPGSRSLVTVNLDGSNTQPITEATQSDDFAPDWAPDGNWICFSSNRGGQNHKIWLIRPNGSDAVLNSFGDYKDSFPAWAPVDGYSIVFSREVDGVYDLWLVAPQNSQ